MSSTVPNCNTMICERQSNSDIQNGSRDKRGISPNCDMPCKVPRYTDNNGNNNCNVIAIIIICFCTEYCSKIDSILQKLFLIDFMVLVPVQTFLKITIMK